MDAILLAGSPRKKSHLIQGKAKYYTRINDTILGNHVLKTIQNVSAIETIYVVGNQLQLKEVIPPNNKIRIIQEVGNIYSNAMEAFKYTRNTGDPETQVLYVACDIPFITSEAIESFLLDSPEGDIIWPYCLHKDFESVFEGFEWPFMVYKEGEVKFGNIVLGKPNKIQRTGLINRFFGLRKTAVSDNREEEMTNIPKVAWEALKLRGLDGLEIVIREIYLKYFDKHLGMNSSIADHLPLERISDTFSKLLGCDVQYVRTTYPELCYDIDNETSDLRYAIQHYGEVMDRIRSRNTLSTVDELK